eukprot:1890508-Rhodomonas_salina.1
MRPRLSMCCQACTLAGPVPPAVPTAHNLDDDDDNDDDDTMTTTTTMMMMMHCAVWRRHVPTGVWLLALSLWDVTVHTLWQCSGKSALFRHQGPGFLASCAWNWCSWRFNQASRRDFEPGTRTLRRASASFIAHCPGTNLDALFSKPRVRSLTLRLPTVFCSSYTSVQPPLPLAPSCARPGGSPAHEMRDVRFWHETASQQPWEDWPTTVIVQNPQSEWSLDKERAVAPCGRAFCRAADATWQVWLLMV